MTAPAVEIRGLSVAFGDHLALRDVNLTLPAGGFLTIVGPNGCGKSTLLKTILGLVPPTAGDVRVFGHAPETLSPLWVGYVPQLKTLDRRFPAIAAELVATGLHRRWPLWLSASDKRKTHDAMKRVGADHLASRPVGELSGGELQRVYLARAIVRDPRLVLLDEPATGIDVKGERDFYLLLEQHHEQSGATILMVTHDWAASRHHASHVLVLKSRQIAYGAPSEVLTDVCLNEAFGHVGHEHAHEHEHEHEEHTHA